jgi:hypothetical protein
VAGILPHGKKSPKGTHGGCLGMLMSIGGMPYRYEGSEQAAAIVHEEILSVLESVLDINSDRRKMLRSPSTSFKTLAETCFLGSFGGTSDL